MKRLTFKKWFEHFKPDEEATTILVNGYTQITEQAEPYESFKNMNYYLIGEAVEKLAAYEDAEEKGMLFKMHCKPGDTVFVVVTETNSVKEYKISKIIIGKNHDQIAFAGGRSFMIWGKKWDEYFNKYIHFTSEAAFQALKQFQEGKTWI